MRSITSHSVFFLLRLLGVDKIPPRVAGLGGQPTTNSTQLLRGQPPRFNQILKWTNASHSCLGYHRYLSPALLSHRILQRGVELGGPAATGRGDRASGWGHESWQRSPQLVFLTDHVPSSPLLHSLSLPIFSFFLLLTSHGRNSRGRSWHGSLLISESASLARTSKDVLQMTCGARFGRWQGGQLVRSRIVNDNMPLSITGHIGWVMGGNIEF